MDSRKKLFLNLSVCLSEVISMLVCHLSTLCAVCTYNVYTYTMYIDAGRERHISRDARIARAPDAVEHKIYKKEILVCTISTPYADDLYCKMRVCREDGGERGNVCQLHHSLSFTN